jgi:DNA repair photolyase
MRKVVLQKETTNPFDIRDGRAMVSLGPLSPKKYCSYSCPFCYVNAGFLSYATKTIEDTVKWLEDQRGLFDIIYVSGDTDSFAPPRMDKGIELLEALSEFNVDLLFTTRAILKEQHLIKLVAIKNKLSEKRKLLFGCVSIAQLYQEHLEPKPIATPFERISQLNAFKEIGLISVHAMRPFLPNVPINEYLELINLVDGKVDVILGEVWYADKSGILETATFNGITPEKLEYLEHQMDFDDNSSIWKVYEMREVEIAVTKKCLDMNIPFFMRSSLAIDRARKNLLNDIH